MVVRARDTTFAYAAMLAARRLEELTRSAMITGVEDNPVVRIMSHLRGMIEFGDQGLGVPFRAQIREQIRLR